MQQWLIEHLERKLQTVFAALIPGARLHSAPPAATPEDGGPWMWWQQTFDMATAGESACTPTSLDRQFAERAGAGIQPVGRLPRALSVGLSAAAVAGIQEAMQP